MNSIYDEVEKERVILNSLVNNAINKGILISNNKKILEQSQRVDKLLEKIQKDPSTKQK